MARQEPHVAAVRPPEHVGHIAHHRHGAEQAVDGNIPGHAEQHALRHAEPPGLVHEPGRERRRRKVAEPGHQAQERIGADAGTDARHAHGAVEEKGQALEPLARGAAVEVGRNGRGPIERRGRSRGHENPPDGGRSDRPLR